MKPSLVRALIALVCLYGFAGGVMTSGANSNLTANDARPVLEVISRLAPVKLSEQTGLSGPLNICFSDDRAFKELNSALGRYKGNASWLLVSRPPLVCLVAMPEEAALRGHQVGTEQQLRNLILQDVSPLSSFLEKELRVTGMPSRGIQVQTDNLPHAFVGNGPGGPTFLVSDPDRYISNGLASTSARDRTVEFWMSEQELDNLYAAFHDTAEPGIGLSGLTILRRVSETTHENLIVLPEEVPKLKQECERMSRVSSGLKDAMLRVIRICDLAAADHLAIVVLGG